MESHQKKSFKQILAESLEKTKNVFKRLLKPLKSIGLIMLGFTLATISPCARSPDANASNFQADQFVIVPSARCSFTYSAGNFQGVEVPTMFLEMTEGLAGELFPTSSVRLVRPPIQGVPTDYYEVLMKPTPNSLHNTSCIVSALQNSYFYLPNFSVTPADYNRVISLGSTMFVLELPLGIQLPTLYPNHVEFSASPSGIEIGSDGVPFLSSRSCSLVWSYMNGTELLFRFSLNWSDSYLTFLQSTSTTYGYATLNPNYLPTTQQAYDMGYAEGFYRGQLSVEPQISPFDALVNAVNSFLSLEILPNVTLRTVFFVGFGLVLFGFLIKIFLGG